MKIVLFIFIYLLIGTVCGAYAKVRYEEVDDEGMAGFIGVLWPFALIGYLWWRFYKIIEEVFRIKSSEKEPIDMRGNQNDERRN